jgi:hypothetical protein
LVVEPLLTERLRRPVWALSWVLLACRPELREEAAELSD